VGALGFYLIVKFLLNSKKSGKNDKDDEEFSKNEKKNKEKTDPLSYEISTFIDPDQIDETPPPPYSLKAMVALINRIASRLMFTDKHDARIVRYSRVPEYDM
jgi:hypothetical protein